MSEKVVYRHPQGRFEVRERTGRGALGGGTYVVREAVLTPQKDSRGTFHRPSRYETAQIKISAPKKIEEDEPEPREAKRMTLYEQERAAELCREGYSVAYIARKIGRANSSVACFLERSGLRPREPKNPVTEAEIDRVEELVAQGYSINKAAQVIGRATQTIYKKINERRNKNG